MRTAWEGPWRNPAGQTRGGAGGSAQRPAKMGKRNRALGLGTGGLGHRPAASLPLTRGRRLWGAAESRSRSDSRGFLNAAPQLRCARAACWPWAPWDEEVARRSPWPGGGRRQQAPPGGSRTRTSTGVGFRPHECRRSRMAGGPSRVPKGKLWQAWEGWRGGPGPGSSRTKPGFRARRVRDRSPRSARGAQTSRGGPQTQPLKPPPPHPRPSVSCKGK